MLLYDGSVTKTTEQKSETELAQEISDQLCLAVKNLGHNNGDRRKDSELKELMTDGIGIALMALARISEDRQAEARQIIRGLVRDC